MGGCATKLRQAFEAEDKGEKPEPPVEEDKKAAEDTEEQLKERVKEIVGEDENEIEIAVVDEIQGCKQRPSLSLLFKQVLHNSHVFLFIYYSYLASNFHFQCHMLKYQN